MRGHCTGGRAGTGRGSDDGILPGNAVSVASVLPGERFSSISITRSYDGARLKADLYNMLVYEPGQFFVTHQDSEKADGMIGTLVVILPSTFTGGEIVVEHHDERVTFGAAKGPLTFVAFYADCHHQVRPITRGYRVALTYNLILEGSAAVASGAASRATDVLAEHVRRFFDTLMPARWRHDKDRERPHRLVYLLRP